MIYIFKNYEFKVIRGGDRAFGNRTTTHRLNEEDSHKGIYRLSLNEEDMPDGNPSKWFLFVMTEPTKKSIGTPSKMVIETESKDGETKQVKECAIEEDLDACFLKSN